MRCTRRLQVTATVKNTSSSAHSSHTPNMPGCSNSSTGVLAPKRNSMQGSAKYRTKLFSPAMALSGSTFCRPARYPHSTSAKKGVVTDRIASMTNPSIATIIESAIP